MNDAARTAPLRFDSGDRRISVLIAISLALVFLALGLHEVSRQTDPEAFDTSCYLGEANHLRSRGGLAAFPGMCLDGSYEQANQHPLYILALSTFATTDLDFFVEAKLLNLVGGLASLLLLFEIARRRFGDLAAGVAGAGLIANATFVTWSAVVGCESLLLLSTLGAIAAMLHGFERPRLWVAAGALAGLAFLAKGNALFILPGFGLAVLAVDRLRALRRPALWGFVAALLVTASPLLVRNTLHFGNPLYNINTHKLAFSQQVLDTQVYVLFDPQRGAGLRIYPDAEPPRIPLPAGDAAESGSRPSGRKGPLGLVRTVVSRVGGGLVTQTTKLIEQMNPLPAILTPFRILKLLAGLAICGAFAVGLALERSRGARIYAVTTVVTFLLCLTLFRPLTRYLLPLIPLMWLYAAPGLLHALGTARTRLARTVPDRPLAAVLTAPAVLLAIAAPPAAALLHPPRPPFQSVEVSERRLEILDWLRATLRPGDSYLEGPDLNWRLEHGAWYIAPRRSKAGPAEFTAFARAYDVDYVVIDGETLTRARYRQGGSDRQAILGEFIGIDDDGSLTLNAPPPGWRLVHRDPRDDMKYLMFSID